MSELPDDYGTPAYEARWIRQKLGLPANASTGDVQGQMHVWDSHQHGYLAYIEAYKCHDKQGEIARLAAALAHATREVETLSNRVASCDEWAKDVAIFHDIPSNGTDAFGAIAAHLKTAIEIADATELLIAMRDGQLDTLADENAALKAKLAAIRALCYRCADSSDPGIRTIMLEVAAIVEGMETHG